MLLNLRISYIMWESNRYRVAAPVAVPTRRGRTATCRAPSSPSRPRGPPRRGTAWRPPPATSRAARRPAGGLARAPSRGTSCGRPADRPAGTRPAGRSPTARRLQTPGGGRRTPGGRRSTRFGGHRSHGQRCSSGGHRPTWGVIIQMATVLHN